MNETNVLAVAYAGDMNPSTRLRILQYIPALEAEGFRFETLFVPQDNTTPAVLDPAQFERADVVFVQRVLTRKLLDRLKDSAKPVVFDMDDSLHYIRQSQYPGAVHPRNPVDLARSAYRAATRGSRFYSGRKRLLDEMLEVASATIVGNEWLFTELGLRVEGATIVPTAVWVDEAPLRVHGDHSPVRLGWIGVKSNLYHLELVRDALASLRERYGDTAVELNIVSSAAVTTPLPTVLTQWSLKTEEDAVLTFDIGIMPLQDDPFSRGKCAFKAVLCMAHGVPMVASPVGANATLIDHGQNGFLASTAVEWVESLSALIDDTAVRSRMGEAARRTIEERYSSSHVLVDLRDVLARSAGLNDERLNASPRGPVRHNNQGRS